MKWLRALCVAALCAVPVGASAWWQSIQQVAISTSGCSQATATIARLDGTQDATHNTAYTTLICNLVTQGVWAKLDVMYVFATNDAANALTNLVSSSFGGTANGSPTFTANAGYTGTDGSTTVYISTGFNPTTATTPHFTQNSAHVSMWSNTNAASGAGGGVSIGAIDTVGQSSILEKYADGNGYFRINDPAGGFSAGKPIANSTGHFVATRSASATQNGYHNAADLGITPVTSAAPQNITFTALANGGSPNPTFGDGNQNMAVTIGASLSAGDVTNLCHELNSFLTTIAGVGAAC